jgi:O-antigen ligase
MIGTPALSDRPAVSPRRRRGFGHWPLDLLWGAWLGLIPLLSFLVSPARMPIYMYDSVDTRPITPVVKMVTALAVAAGAIPAVISLVTGRYDLRKVALFPLISFPILAMIAISLFGNGELGDISTLGLGVFVFTLMALFASDTRMGDEAMTRFLMVFALMHCIVLALVVVDGNFLWGRLMGRNGPNFWGTVCYYTIFAAFVVRPVWLRIAVMGWAGAVLLMTQNRTSMIAVIAGCGVIFVLTFARSTPRRRLTLSGWLLTGLLAVAAASPIIAQKIFLVDSRSRGLDSGGTGRFEAWEQTLEVWKTSPLIGVGYRHHEGLISAASSAHNAYLAVLADMGVLGLFAYLLFLGFGLVVGIRTSLQRGSWTVIVLTGFLVAFAVCGFFESRALNFGNSGSLLMIAAIAWMSRPDSWREAR